MTAAGAARSRLVHWQDPAVLFEAFRDLGGMETLRRIADGSLPRAPMTELLDMELAEVQEGRTVWTATPGEEHYNEAGLIHGGFAVSVLETTLGTTLISTLPPGTRPAGVQLSVDFLAALKPSKGPVRSEGRIVRLGRRIAVVDAELRAQRDGELLARVSGTFSLLRPEEASR